MFDVVSCPASSNRPAMPMSSSSVSSVPWSRTSMPRMSSPGCCRARSTNELMYARPCRCSSSRSGIGMDRSSWRALRRWKSSRSSYGTPSSSQITSDGIGSAKLATKSAGGPAFSIASSCASTISTMRGSSRFILRIVNSAGEHAPQPLMLRRVEAQQIACPRAGLLLLGDVRRAGYDETRWPAVGEPLVVGQHILDVLVPGDEEDLHAERVDDGAHAVGLADLAKLWSRIEGVAPHV